MIDLHVHSYLSVDSNAIIEEYIDNESKSFVITDHFEFTHCFGNAPWTVNMDEYNTKLATLKNKFPNIKFYKGLEIGYNKIKTNEINKFIKDEKLDIVLISFHDNGKYNYMDMLPNQKLDIDEMFDIMLFAINNLEKIDVITHMDYPFRTNLLKEEFFTSPKLVQIFDLMKEKDIALEINTSSMYNYKNYDFYLRLLEAYKVNGNNLISLGSDCHTTNNYRFHFDEVLELVKDFEILNRRY